MAKCLRCGAGNEWIQGNVPDEPVEPAEGPMCAVCGKPENSGFADHPFAAPAKGEKR